MKTRKKSPSTISKKVMASLFDPFANPTTENTVPLRGFKKTITERWRRKKLSHGGFNGLRSEREVEILSRPLR